MRPIAVHSWTAHQYGDFRLGGSTAAVLKVVRLGVADPLLKRQT
jgi:hypothetical protein